MFRNKLKYVLKKFRTLQARRYKHIYLPITRSNENLSDDEEYITSAIEQVESLQYYCNISQKTRVLDFGCGQGRFANGLLLTKPDLGYYCGIDTDLEAIKWCKRWIWKYHQNFVFIHVDAYNARYNPKAMLRPELPISPNSFDIAFLNSVFSHMLADDVQYYLHQINQVLRKQGILYLTAFIEKNVPAVEENPPGYLNKKSTGPLHRVRYERSFFSNMIKKAGFETKNFQHQGIRRNKQSILVAIKVVDLQ